MPTRSTAASQRLATRGTLRPRRDDGLAQRSEIGLVAARHVVDALQDAPASPALGLPVELGRRATGEQRVELTIEAGKGVVQDGEISGKHRW